MENLFDELSKVCTSGKDGACVQCTKTGVIYYVSYFLARDILQVWQQCRESDLHKAAFLNASLKSLAATAELIFGRTYRMQKMPAK